MSAREEITQLLSKIHPDLISAYEANCLENSNTIAKILDECEVLAQGIKGKSCLAKWLNGSYFLSLFSLLAMSAISLLGLLHDRYVVAMFVIALFMFVVIDPLRSRNDRKEREMQSHFDELISQLGRFVELVQRFSLPDNESCLTDDSIRKIALMETLNVLLNKNAADDFLRHKWTDRHGALAAIHLDLRTRDNLDSFIYAAEVLGVKLNKNSLFKEAEKLHENKG